MNIVVGVIVGLVVLMILVVAHEYGHFRAARRNGVRVLEFGIGFPPRAIAWQKKNGKWIRLKREKTAVTKAVGIEKTEKKRDGSAVGFSDNEGLIFSINWIPIGGFCQMDGESAEDTREGTFGKASFWAKTKILFAGVAMNWLVAWIVFTVLAVFGMPVFVGGQFTIEADTRTTGAEVEVVRVLEGSPAEKAGMLAGDKILEVEGKAVSYSSEVSEINSEHAGEEVVYKVARGVEYCGKTEGEACDAEELSVRWEWREVKIRLNGEEAEYLLGVAMQSGEMLRYSTWSAPITGAGVTLQLTGETFKGLGQMVWNLISGVGSQLSFDGEVRENGREAISEAGESVAGPIGILGTLFPAFTEAGPRNLAFLAALISVSLACMNVLPIPALDGGRWLLIAIYKARGKKLAKETEEKIVARAFMVLLAIIAIVTVLDITRFFR